MLGWIRNAGIYATAELEMPLQGNIKTWLKGDDASTINAGSPSVSDPVETWADFLGSGNNATQSTPAVRPTWESTYVQATGSEWLTFGDVLSKMSQRSVYIVFQLDSVSGNEAIYSDHDSGGLAAKTSLALRRSGATPQTTYGDDTNFRQCSESNVLTTNITLYGDRYTSGNVDPCPIMQLDGVDLTEASTGTATTISGPKQDLALFRLGEFNGLYMSGKIFEFIVYDVELSDDNNNLVNTILKYKYNIS